MADAADGPVRAAGAIVWRHHGAGQEIALVHRPRYDDWSHPKGKCQHGEHILRAAVREVEEETGVRVVLGRPLGPSVYPVAAGIKHVSYWAGRCAQSAGFAPDDEVDEMAWLSPEAARERLSYARDVVLLDEFAAGPALTAPLILLRHAEAGPRPDPPGPGTAAADLARPLDASGAADAQILAAVLASYGKCRVISSPAERCLATVRPYAAASGMPAEAEPALAVTPDPAWQAELVAAAAGRGCDAGARGGESADPVLTLADLGAQLVARIVAAGEPAVICAHRENLPRLIDAAFAALGAVPPDREPLGKSEFWVLHAADGALVSAERHDPLR